MAIYPYDLALPRFISPNVIKTYNPADGVHTVAVNMKRLAVYRERKNGLPEDGLGKRYDMLNLHTGHLEDDDGFHNYLTGWNIFHTTGLQQDGTGITILQQDVALDDSVTGDIGLRTILSAFLIRFGIDWNDIYLEENETPALLEPESFTSRNYHDRKNNDNELVIETGTAQPWGNHESFRVISKTAKTMPTVMKMAYNVHTRNWDVDITGDHYRVENAFEGLRKILGKDVHWLEYKTKKYTLNLNHRVFDKYSAHELFAVMHYFLTGLIVELPYATTDMRVCGFYRNMNE